MHWNYFDFEKWISEGCKKDVAENVRALDMRWNQLTTNPDSISALTNLHTLSISANKLTTLPDSISALTNLRVLFLRNNQLTVIPDSIFALTNLHTLDLCRNIITTLPVSIPHLLNLRYLYLGNNKLTTLPDSISGLTNLCRLDISWNRLTTLPPCLGNLRQLRLFWYGNNPIDYIPANVMRMINRTDTVQGVYNDSQSVHNSTIQKSLLDSVNRLLAIPILQGNIIDSILEDFILSNETKARLVEYSEDTNVHTVLNLTFSEMLAVVWNRIGMLESRDEIKKTLNTEIHDAECKCFTGKISRLVNCLAGYDDLVVVEIADKEQIGIVIEIVRNRLGESYTVEEHKRISIIELVERGYSREVIDEWVGYIE